MNPAENPLGKHAGLDVHLGSLGRVRLLQAIARNPDTSLYQTDHAGVVVKVFDLECGRPDEVSYGPLANFQAELATFREIEENEPLRYYVPACFGADIDYDRKHAFIAMEYLEGQNLRSWGEETALVGYESAQLDELRRAVVEALSILDLFHRHGLIVIDFKPDNVIRLADGTVRFVDLGAFFTPRHRQDLSSFVYAATPDHAEVLIDASNLQAQVAPTVASDVFAAGVALFELATGDSRLAVAPATAEEMLASPALYRFRDSQIADVWKAFPHLRQALPTVQTQLRERRLLFSEFWHLLKAFLTEQVEDWEELGEPEQGQILLTSGTTFIMEQLPVALSWLAGAVARATVLRSLRLRSIAELVPLLGNPAPEAVLTEVSAHNGLVTVLEDLGLPADFARRLNTWDVRPDPVSGHWAVAGPAVCWELRENAAFVFLQRIRTDEQGQTWWRAVDEFEADLAGGVRVSLVHLRNDHRAWVG